MTSSHPRTRTRPGDDQLAEHARRLVDRLTGRGLRAVGAPHVGGLPGVMAVAAQRVDVHPYAWRQALLLPAQELDEPFWHWPRPYSGYEDTGARWFQPFCPASAYDDTANEIVAAIDVDLRNRDRRGDAGPVQALLARPDGEAGERQVLDNVGRPLHKLVYRQLVALDATQRGVEDPALLRRLYEIDHLAMRTLRGLERIAVLGGAMARQLPEPLPLSTVMRQAAAQVEHYSRVRIPPPGIDVELPRDVAPEITLLLAELIENATRFSPLETDVLLTAAPVPSAGLRIEIADRGLPMPQDQRAALNRLLAEPGSAVLREQIISKRIGLLVVARLAEHHGVRVVLHPRTGGGSQAVVELPEALLLESRLRLLSAAPTARVIRGVLEPAVEPVIVPAPAQPAQPAKPVEAAGAVDAPLPRRRTKPAAGAEPASAPKTDSAAGGPPPLPSRGGAHRRGGSHRAVSNPSATNDSTGSNTSGAGIGAAAAFLQGVHDPATEPDADQTEGGPPPEALPN
ncbi:sensor histidine kinase [Actinomadura sp. 3N407]|uniref:sensor histidine kinase n=1 Tax=Actinomadura sp. 3N407 TaxID=3457423 RepID=UPI003FCE08D0